MSAPQKAETPPQTENKLEASKLYPGKFETVANLASSALHAAAYEGIQQPLTSLGQYVDHFKSGAHLTEKLQFIAPVKEAKFGTLEWHADQLGAAAGQMLPYLTSRYLLKPFFAEGKTLSNAGVLSKPSPLKFSVAEAASTGFVSQVLFHPVANQDDFAREKFVDGAKGALNMTVLTGTTHGLKYLSEKPFAHTLKISGVLANPFASGLLSGVPAGIIGAEVDSQEKSRHWASSADVLKSVYGMAMVGGTFGAIASGSKTSKVSEISASKGVQTEFDFGKHSKAPPVNLDKAPEVVSQPIEGDALSAMHKGPAQLELKFEEPQMVLDFGDRFALPAYTEYPAVTRNHAPPELDQGRANHVDNAQQEIQFPEPLTPLGKKAYDFLLQLEKLPSDENARITEGKYPIKLAEAQAIHILLDEWHPGAQRLYNQISARGEAARSMAYDVWVNSSLQKVQQDMPRFYERALIASHPGNKSSDRSSYVSISLDRQLGMETPEEVDKFLTTWRRTRPLITQLDYQGDVHCPTLLQMVRSGLVDDIPDAALKPIAEHYRIYDKKFTKDEDLKALIAAAPGWEAVPFVPLDVATKLAGMSARERLSGDPALFAAKNQLPKSNSSRELFEGENGDAAREAFYKNLAEISKLPTRAIVKRIKWEDSIELAVDALYGDTISPEHKVALMTGVKQYSRPAQLLAGIDLPTFKEAYDKLMVDNPLNGEAEKNRFFDWQSRSATMLATVFKKNWPAWLEAQQKAGRDNYEATTWLRANEPTESRGLSQFLLQHGKKPTKHLEKISEAWPQIKEGDKAGDYKEALRIGLLAKYPVINDVAFAEEASRWEMPASKYEAAEQRFIASKDVPSPFPLDEKWTVGALTGRFIPRDDPRGVFLGEHTNCCQNPGGNGESSAWFGQESSKSGFFVVEDVDGEVVSQSWAVVTDSGGLLFDNVEAKGLDKRQETVKRIYQNAANSLTNKFHTITMGTENSDLKLDGFPDAGAQTQKLPVSFSGYTDAKNQVLLATSTVVSPTPFEAPVFRGALNLDKSKMGEISQARFPEDWQALPWEPATRGLVLDHPSDGILGYALYEPANRYVSDIAAKPNIHPRYGHQLTAQLFRTLQKQGGDWTADLRESTTYRMLQRAAKLNHVKVISDTVGDEPMGTEQMHHVVFNVDKLQAKPDSQ